MESEEERWMLEAVRLGRMGRKHAFPNPAVGCVLVSGGVAIARGYTQPYGREHAERHCLQKVESAPADSTLYVTLEPCNHFGATPPCVDILLEKGVKRVVVALRDPNPHVCGGGCERLQAAGIEVVEGVCKEVVETELKDFLLRVRSSPRGGIPARGKC